jgi:LAS superfamily LD-carboxypeptidase LdcB
LGRSSSWARGVYGPLADDVQRLIDAAGRAGILVTVSSGRRTHAQQRALYRRYLAGINPYPVARPGTSDHEYGYAVDLWAGDSERTRQVGRAWRSWGGRWNENDEVHFTIR